MAPDHELWDGTIAFAAGCPWKAAAFLGQRRWSQTILKITKELLWPCAMMTRRLSAHLPIGMKCQEKYGCGPLIGFLFVAEKYRGNRLSEQMVNAACNVAKEQGFSAIYLMSGEVGLYGKYSFTKVGDYKTMYGSVNQLFSKTL